MTVSIRYLDPPAIKPPKRPPHFTPEKWTFAEKLKRLRVLCPRKAVALEGLLDLALRDEWPTSASLRKEWQKYYAKGGV
jgi:hypothetical protein